jgi:hypothetical protein
MVPMVKLVLRVSASVARDIDALGRDRDSRGSVVRDALMSFLHGDFPFREGSGHADWSPNWGRLLPRPALDTSVKEVKESRSIRITINLSPTLVASVDTAVKRHNFDNRTEFIRAILAPYLSWRSSHPATDTSVKEVIPPSPSVVTIASSNFSFSSGESER